MSGSKNLLGFLLLIVSFVVLVFAAKLNTILGSSYGIETDEVAFDFHLKKSSGEEFKLNELKGNFVYIYFGYLNCSSLCPLRMSNLIELSKKNSRKDLRFVYITIDPSHDTEEKLKLFSEPLGENFLVLYSDPETIKRIARGYKVFYEKEPNGQWNHTDKTFLLDRDLHIRHIYLSSQKNISKMEEDLTRLAHNLTHKYF